MLNKLDSFTLSIIIPCFNEINTIGELISRVKKAPIDSKEIIIIDNCSTESTIIDGYDGIEIPARNSSPPRVW